jgi:hypothetical protein
MERCIAVRTVWEICLSLGTVKLAGAQQLCREYNLVVTKLLLISRNYKDIG